MLCRARRASDLPTVPMLRGTATRPAWLPAVRRSTKPPVPRASGGAAHVDHSFESISIEYRAHLISVGATEKQARRFSGCVAFYAQYWRLYDDRMSEIYIWRKLFDGDRDAYMVRIHSAAAGLLSENEAFDVAHSFIKTHPERLITTQHVATTVLRLHDVALAHGVQLGDVCIRPGVLLPFLLTTGEDGAVHTLNDALQSLSFLPSVVLRAVVQNIDIIFTTSADVDEMRRRWEESSLSKISAEELEKESQHARFQSYITNILC